MDNDPPQQRCRLAFFLIAAFLSLDVATFVQTFPISLALSLSASKERMSPSNDYITPEKETPQRRSKRAIFKNSRYRDITATIPKWIDREERSPKKRRRKWRGGGGRKEKKKSVKETNDVFDGLESVSFTYSELEAFKDESYGGGDGEEGEREEYEDHIQRFDDAWREYEEEIDLVCREEELEEEEEEIEEEEEQQQQQPPPPPSYLHHHRHRIYFFKVPQRRMQEHRAIAGI